MFRNFVKKYTLLLPLLGLTLLCSERIVCRFLFLQAKHDPIWDVSYSHIPLEQVKNILIKPLNFVGSGSQCFAFTAKKDEYVVKICKASRYKNPQKKEPDFSSYLLAFEELAEHTQIVFLHLNPTKQLQISMKFIDPLGIPHFAKADQISFYIQKKLVPFSDYVNSFLPFLSISQAQNIVRELLELCAESSKKSLQIRDIQWKNIGVLDDKCFWMDPGRIRKKNVPITIEEQKKEFMRLSNRLKPLLVSMHLNFEAVLEEAIAKKLEDILRYSHD